jgi:hypothetical protein
MVGLGLSMTPAHLNTQPGRIEEAPQRTTTVNGDSRLATTEMCVGVVGPTRAPLTAC